MEAGDRVRLVRPPGQPNGIGLEAYPGPGYLTFGLVPRLQPRAVPGGTAADWLQRKTQQ